MKDTVFIIGFVAVVAVVALLVGADVSPVSSQPGNLIGDAKASSASVYSQDKNALTCTVTCNYKDSVSGNTFSVGVYVTGVADCSINTIQYCPNVPGSALVSTDIAYAYQETLANG